MDRFNNSSRAAGYVPKAREEGNAFQFVAPDPKAAMDAFAAGLSRAVHIPASRMAVLIEQDNARRDAKRTQSGQAKRGPEPKA
jgi:hypothetical protein